jgi:hypothetical protein
LFQTIGCGVADVDFGQWGGGETRRIIFMEAPRLHLSVMCDVRHPVVQIHQKKLFEVQMRSEIESYKDAWMCGE